MKYLPCLLLFITLSVPVRGGAGSLVASREPAGRVRIEFTGVLQSAVAPEGPWIDVAGAVSPHVDDPEVAGVGRFFRARESGGGGLFDSVAVVEWVVEGPLQQHFDLAFAGMPDGIFPPRREKPYFPARLWMGGMEVPVTMRVRGNSSLQECPFPKMKVKVSRADRVGTPFEAAREVRIGTHCAEGGSGTIGRLRDQTATYREALAYEVQSMLGFVSPRVRRARIEYRDTTVGGMEPEVGWRVAREAVVMEDVEVVAERMGGRALSEEEVAGLRDAGFSESLLVDLRLLQVLLGNWDYQLSNEGRNLWNVEVIELGDGTRVPVAGDYDLSGWVTGVTTPSWPRDYHPELGEVEREARFKVEELAKQAGPVLMAAGRDRFVAQREPIEAWVRGARVDEAGRTNALRHLSAFYGALEVVVGE